MPPAQDTAIAGVGSAFSSVDTSGMTPQQIASVRGVQSAFAPASNPASNPTPTTPTPSPISAPTAPTAPTIGEESYIDPSTGQTYASKTDYLFESMKSSLDATTKATIDAIQQQYGLLKQKQADINDRAAASRTAIQLTTGTARYAPEVATGETQATLSYGLQQIQSLDTQENAAIAAANAAKQQGDFQIMQKQIDYADELRKEKQDQAQKIYDQQVKDYNTLKDKEDAMNRDNAIADLVTSGITDTKQIMSKLAEKGIITDAKTVADTLDAISKNMGTDTDKLSGDIKDFYILKKQVGGLPTNILSLPLEEQLPAYIKWINQAKETTLDKLSIQEKELAIKKAQEELGGVNSETANVVITGEKPTGPEGNIVDPATGFTPNSIYNNAIDWALSGKNVQSYVGGLSSKPQAQSAKQAIVNTANALVSAAGTTLPMLRAEYKANQTTLNKLIPFYNLTTAFENTANDNLGLALQQSDKVARTGSKLVNRYLQWYQGELTPAAGLTQFETYIYTAAREYAKVTSGAAMSVAGLTDSASRAVDDLLSAATSPEAFQATVTAMQQDMDNVKGNYEDQIRSVSNTIADFLGVSTQTTQSTHRNPLNISIPSTGNSENNPLGL